MKLTQNNALESFKEEGGTEGTLNLTSIILPVNVHIQLICKLKHGAGNQLTFDFRCKLIPTCQIYWF